jgi:hypothetical protein
MMVWSGLAYSSLFLMTKKLVKKEGAGTAAMEGGAKGLVAAGALAAAIGGIYLFSHRAPKKSAKTAKSWILRAKADVMEEVQKIPHVSRKAYLGVVQSVLKHYANLKDASKDELSGLKKDLEGHWETVVKNLKKE